MLGRHSGMSIPIVLAKEPQPLVATRVRGNPTDIGNCELKIETTTTGGTTRASNKARDRTPVRRTVSATIMKGRVRLFQGGKTCRDVIHVVVTGDDNGITGCTALPPGGAHFDMRPVTTDSARGNCEDPGIAKKKKARSCELKYKEMSRDDDVLEVSDTKHAVGD